MSAVRRWVAKVARLYEETDARRHLRIPADFLATLSGPFGMYSVRGVDANRDGTGVECEIALPPGALVFLKIADLNLMGFAHVRHCSRRGDGYLLGLEFREPLARDRAGDGSWAVGRLRRDWNEADAF